MLVCKKKITRNNVVDAFKKSISTISTTFSSLSGAFWGHDLNCINLCKLLQNLTKHVKYICETITKIPLSMLTGLRFWLLFLSLFLYSSITRAILGPLKNLLLSWVLLMMHIIRAAIISIVILLIIFIRISIEPVALMGFCLWLLLKPSETETANSEPLPGGQPQQPDVDPLTLF